MFKIKKQGTGWLVYFDNLVENERQSYKLCDAWEEAERVCFRMNHRG